MTSLRVPALVATLALIPLASPAPAAACGGFFCDNAQPVNQQAERIIFAEEPDGTVTAVIQITYAGPSERFAWMLPVAGVPDIAVSSNAAFNRLQQASNPVYTMDVEVEGVCMQASRSPENTAVAFDDMGMTEVDMGVDGGPVTVVGEGTVGPYDFVIVSLDPGAEDLVDVAIEWLQDNGYDVPAMGSDVLRPYLEAEMNLLAFRLTKGNDAGAIRPVRLSFGAGLPSIPLRPTAVAAEPDMGILVWVLGESRAVPANYRDLELNEAYIDWFRPNATYDDVVTRAANEAGGQGFVTEMSGSAPELGAVVWTERDAARWDLLRTTDWAGNEGQLLANASLFLPLDGMREVLGRTLERPEGVSEQMLLDALFFYFDRFAEDIPGLEPERFLADLAAEVVEPMVATQALFERAAVQTRLYTTMSPGEMTMDPVFDFNADLGPLSNQHRVTRVVECAPNVRFSEASWRVELASGDVVRGTGRSWPFDPASDAMPASARVKRIGNEGEGELVEDNAAAIRAAIAEHNATVPNPRWVESSDFCAAGAPGSSAGFGALALVFAALGLRRRRCS